MLIQLASLFALCISSSVPTPDYYDYSENYQYSTDVSVRLVYTDRWIPPVEELRETQKERNLKLIINRFNYEDFN